SPGERPVLRRRPSLSEEHSTTDRVRADLPTFEESVKEELWAFCRTIFRLGRRDDTHKKKSLTLTFDYEPKARRVRERFTLRDAKLSLTEDLIAGYKKAGNSWAEDIRYGSANGRSAQRLAVEAGWFELSVIWSVYYKEGAQTGFYSYPMGYQVPPAFFNTFGPIDKRALRPNWERELRLALRGPDRTTSEFLVEDMMASEDEEGQMRIAELLGMLDDQ
ncbi:hypothetical protein P7C70_g5195, partial [Phenoliferia sp. Uapishka_3]